MDVVLDFLNDGVPSPIWVIFNDIYTFPYEVVSCEVFFPFFWSFLGR